MHWHKIQSEQALSGLIEKSAETPVLFFKHSYRCSISAVALRRLEKGLETGAQIIPVLVDVINERPISNRLAQTFDIWHESPQALLIKAGKCVYHASHLEISYSDITSKAA